ncbi:MAG: PEP-CTERM sorting domain-containing protein [Verrucomicrobiota bacterium]
MSDRNLPANTKRLGAEKGLGVIFVAFVWTFFGSLSALPGSNLVLQVDLGSDTSNRPNPASPNWNYASDSSINGTTVNLIDFNTGSGTGISMERTGFLPFPAAAVDLTWDIDGSGPFPPPVGDPGWVEEEAGFDGFVVFGGNDPMNPVTGTITFSGMDDLATYQVEVVAVWFDGDVSSSQFFDLTDYTVQGGFTDRTNTASGQPPTVGMDWSPVFGHFTRDWMIWEDVAPAAGEIVIDVIPDTNNQNHGIISAIRITQTTIPEPTGVLLLLLALGFGIWRR